ncbi:MAG: DNA polymerase-3 subunit beta [Parvicellaceae bacterium]|jgi:DNA polymerase-3 subunit beta
MKFIVSSSSLLKQLQGIGGVLNSSNTLPILDNFLFEIKGKLLTVYASDLETTMTTSLEVEAKEDGNICMPAKMLMDTLKAFPDQPLTFDIDNKTYGVEISSDNGKYKLSGQNGAEFPKVPTLESPSKVEMPANILATAINKTIFATGNDDLRPVMSGVYFQLEKDGITFVATDAHKLVRYKRTDAKADKGASFIVPKKPLNLLKGLMGSTDSNVTLEYNESNAFFAFDNITLICRLIDGKYPNYEAVIPNENPNRLTIDRTGLQNSIKRVSIFANKTTNQVRLKMTGSDLMISAEDLDFSNAANERLTCNYQGEDMEIGFNSRFLVEMITNMDSDEAIIEMSAPNRAGIILPGGEKSGDEEILMLVMPVMLNS